MHLLVWSMAQQSLAAMLWAFVEIAIAMLHVLHYGSSTKLCTTH